MLDKGQKQIEFEEDRKKEKGEIWKDQDAMLDTSSSWSKALDEVMCACVSVRVVAPFIHMPCHDRAHSMYGCMYSPF